MGLGNSHSGGLMVRTEAIFGTDPGAAVIALDILSESIAVQQALVPSGSIWTSRERELITPTIYDVAGDIACEASGVNMPQWLLYLTGQVSSAVSPMSITAAPTATPAAGGSLQVGTFRYYLCPVYTDPAGRRIIWGRSSEFSGTTAGGNLTLDLAWVNAVTLDDGYTLYGTEIYRTQTGGGVGTEFRLAVVVGAGTAYSDTGSVNIGGTPASAITVPGLVYRHTFNAAAPVAGTNPMNSFALSILKDLNTNSARFNGCRMNQMAISAAAGEAPVQATFSILGQRYISSLANPSPAPSIIGPFMAHRTQIHLAGTFTALAEGFDLTVSNNLEAIRSLDDQAYIRQIHPGMRAVTGTLRRGFEDWTEFNRVGGAAFAIRSRFQGPQLSTTADVSADTAFGMRYLMTLNMANCHYRSGMGKLSGASRMVEELPFEAFVGAGNNDLTISVDNLTASVA